MVLQVDAEEVVTDAVGPTGVEGHTDDAIEGALDGEEGDTGINFNDWNVGSFVSFKGMDIDGKYDITNADDADNGSGKVDVSLRFVCGFEKNNADCYADLLSIRILFGYLFFICL